ncbi:hypothetical protein SAMN05216289_1721, partial [Dokdonella immobilis]
MRMPLFSENRGWLTLALGGILCAVIYAPGLAGSFALDDSIFVVGNKGVHVTANTLSDWIAAAMSFPSGSHQGRWLGMLSFAANHYFTGMDPYA